MQTFAAQHDTELAGPAIDQATSAFHIPPEKRKAVREWPDTPEDFDCVIYRRQDRLVRRAADFTGLVTWSKGNGKALYGATSRSVRALIPDKLAARSAVRW